MVIAIDLTSLSYHMTGIERYALCVTEQMLAKDHTNRYILIFRNEIYHSLSRFLISPKIKAAIIKGNNKLLLYQFTLVIQLYRIKADKYIFFAFTSPIFFRKKGIYNTIHDMGAWDSPFSMKFLQMIYFRLTTRLSAINSEGIITVSNFSKKRISEILNINEAKIQVIYSALSESLITESHISINDIRKKYNLPEKYIMSLSTLEPRKNLELLLKAFTEVKNKVDYDLVLVGRTGWKMKEILAKYHMDSKIHLTGFVEDNEVSVLYKNTLCFIFPSLYEGFGLPPIEALALGAPVLASNAASIPEILMEQAQYFESNNLKSLENALMNLSSNVSSMWRCLNDFQKENYRFEKSAEKVINYITL